MLREKFSGKKSLCRRGMEQGGATRHQVPVAAWGERWPICWGRKLGAVRAWVICTGHNPPHTERIPHGCTIPTTNGRHPRLIPTLVAAWLGEMFASIPPREVLSPVAKRHGSWSVTSQTDTANPEMINLRPERPLCFAVARPATPRAAATPALRTGGGDCRPLDEGGGPLRRRSRSYHHRHHTRWNDRTRRVV